ncbi:MAG: hypothetical protein V7641_5033 [Blastocatellia bacterium]
MPLIRRKRGRWLSGERACELLGIEGTEKTPAARRLAANAERWGIRKIRLGNGARGTVAHPELDLYEYMERKEREAAGRVKPSRRAKISIDPSFLKMRAQKKWLSARTVIYLLGMVAIRIDDTPAQIKAAERNAIRLLNKHAERWGIRRIDERGAVKRSLAAYPEEDVLEYMRRKEMEARERTDYLSRYPTYFKPVKGPGVSRWWGDKKLELSMQLGPQAKSAGEPSSYFIKIEVRPDDSVPALSGYVEAAEVARRFNIKPGKVYSSRFWQRFAFYLGEPFRSAKRFNGDLIELYFKEKAEAGEKVYLLATRKRQGGWKKHPEE